MLKKTLKALAFALGAAMAPGEAVATSVQEIVRLEGQGETVLQGFGIVVGLPGTGDSGQDLLVARPLAQLLASQGNPVGDLSELAKSKSAAVVQVTCTIRRTGAKVDDTFDVVVSAFHNAKSLAGGELFLTPLRGPLAGQGVYAIAQGTLVVEGGTSTRARVPGGARVVRSIDMSTVAPDGSITLIIEPHKSGWTTSQLLASIINDHRVGLDDAAEEIATAIDERSVRVVAPAAELADPANFIADILSIRFDPTLLALPARVKINTRQGVIVVTGDVQISPALITHGALVITTVTPPPQPTPQNPLIERERWSVVGGASRDRDMARLQDLLTAFKQLDVPVSDQIAILRELHATGRLHAELVID